MAEMPLVVIDVQRGGPSTGLPTMVEQSDLNIAVYGSHGDAPRVVLATSSVEDCFYTAIEAVNIAREYSVPVIILSDQSIGTRIEAFPEPELEKVCQDLTPDLTPVASHQPYDLTTPNGITHHIPAGTRILDGKYPVATGLEHDEHGHPSGSPKYHRQMTAKRRRKLQALGERLPQPEIYGPAEGQVLLVSWGSSYGPAKEAVDRAAASGEKLSLIHLRHISPMPNNLDKIFAGFERIYTVELNDEGLYDYGQLGGLLRARYADNRIRSISKTDGLTFRVGEILDTLRTRLAKDLPATA